MELPSNSTTTNKSCQVKSSRWCALLLTGMVLASSGANCQQLLPRYTQPMPRVLPPAATLGQVTEVVNQNSSGITSFSTSKATVSTPGYPALSANLAFQRPRSFRMRADLAIIGPEVDLGSNDQLFWFWVKRNQPPGMFFCYHDQFANSAARQVLPVQPEWLAQAMGVVSFDAGDQHEGPYPVRGGKLEIRSTTPGPTGARRVTIIDEASGIVLEQHVYDMQGTRLASSTMSNHQRDPVTGVIMPRRVRIEWPTSHFEMRIEMADLQINQLSADPVALFTKPEYPGYVNIDLANPNAMQAMPAAASATGAIVPFPSGAR